MLVAASVAVFFKSVTSLAMSYVLSLFLGDGFKSRGSSLKARAPHCFFLAFLNPWSQLDTAFHQKQGATVPRNPTAGGKLA